MNILKAILIATICTTLFTGVGKMENDILSYGAFIKNGETEFRLMAPKADMVCLVIFQKYDDEIVAYMDECLENEKKAPGLIQSFAERKRDYWRMDRSGNSDFAAKMKPYILKTEDKDLEDYDGQIESLPYMEYQIFNVVFIYNTFDWDKYDLILTGW